MTLLAFVFECLCAELERRLRIQLGTFRSIYEYGMAEFIAEMDRRAVAQLYGG